MLPWNLQAETKVTYGLSKGRLGDQFVSYLHAKWIAHRYSIPLLYRPFPHSDSFLFHTLETPVNRRQKTITLTNLQWLERPADCVYLIPYAPECQHDYTFFPPGYQKEHPYVEVDWEDKKFIEWVRPYLSLRVPIQLIPLPSDKVTVALHIRRLAGEDALLPNLLSYFPYKFLPDSFYIEQLRWIYQEMGEKPLYVYLFSNDPNLQGLAKSYQAALQLPNITFDFRPPRTDALLSDFFSMMHFTILVRPESNLSIVADRLGFQKIVLSPEHVTIRKGAENVVDKVKIKRK